MLLLRCGLVISTGQFRQAKKQELREPAGRHKVWLKDTREVPLAFLEWSHNFLLRCPAAPSGSLCIEQFSTDSLHASGVELAPSHWYSDHTGGEGQQQSVARPVQSQRQQLPGLQRVLSTPADTHTQRAKMH